MSSEVRTSLPPLERGGGLDLAQCHLPDDVQKKIPKKKSDVCAEVSTPEDVRARASRLILILSHSSEPAKFQLRSVRGGGVLFFV